MGKEGIDIYIAVLVGIEGNDNNRDHYEDSLDELSQLAKTAGFKTAGCIIQDRHRITPRWLLSRGKLEELHRKVCDSKADVVIFDDDITPRQAGNLKKYLSCTAIDRRALILKIFEEHARTREAKTQVELARLNYNFSRLTGKWEHLSRQKGGIGLREVGEKQLELDRRLIKGKINKLKQRLKSINKEREIQRKLRSPLFTAALVGYTNAGKSTIMNSLTGSNLLVEDKLFATLDSTVRVLEGSIKHKILISDTVGFINKLPHQLVASFTTTLNEVRFADLLIKVVDISVPSFERQIGVITATLEDLGLQRTRSFWVFNKTDMVDREIIRNVDERFHDSVFISAVHSVGIDRLIDKIEKNYKDSLIQKSVLIGYDRTDLLADIYRIGYIENKEYGENGVFLTFRIPKEKLGYVEKVLKL